MRRAPQPRWKPAWRTCCLWVLACCCGEKLGELACLSEREASGARAGVLTLLLFTAMVWSDLGETETDARPGKWQQAEFVWEQ
ncbi:hypothetical protein FJTKL_11343 [Diaporthe vaccinii]|uniref:Uncharacterized protein n=1 Tax=Diaporthe vaccinii TaxID=105482 RepID=A0ABR4EHH7_9PEZI